MKRWYIPSISFIRFLPLMLIVLFAFAPITQAQDAPNDAVVTALRQIAREEGQVRVIVGLKTANPTRFTDPAAAETIRQARENLLTALAGQTVRVTREYTLFPMLALRVDATALETLIASPLVRYVQEDAVRRPVLDDSTEQIEADGINGAWDRGYDGTGWTVAILDTGVRKDHPFLEGKVIGEACFGTNEDEFTSLCPAEVGAIIAPGAAADCAQNIAGCGHGTHVASIAAGDHWKYAGVAPKANIIAVKVFSRAIGLPCLEAGDPSPCVRTFDSDVINGLLYVLTLNSTYNIASANMSLGGGFYQSELACDVAHPAYLDVFTVLWEAGIAPVVASGNDDYTNAISSPGCLSKAISVGNVRDNDKVNPSSNAASFLELLAPGSGIVAANAFWNGFETTESTSMTGTSMATPHVAGAFAILRQLKPDASVDELLATLRNNGKMITDPRNGLEFPRLNVRWALEEYITPGQPQNVKVKPKSQTKINIVWPFTSPGDTFKLQIATPSGWETLVATPLPGASHEGLFCDFTVLYRVIAVNENGDSEPSVEKSGTTHACLAPAKVVAKPFTLGGVLISWTATPGTKAYEVQWRKDSRSLWTPLDSTAETFILDTDIACGTQRAYRVRSVGFNDPSPWTTPTVGIAADCQTPENLLVNGSFEKASRVNTNLPQSWTDSGPMRGDFLVNNAGRADVSIYGDLAFQFKGNIDERSRLIQKINPQGFNLEAGQRLFLSAAIDQLTAVPGSKVATLTVKYGDGTTASERIVLPETPIDGYKTLAAQVILASSDVRQIIVQVEYRAPSGTFWVDNVTLKVLTLGTVPETSIPLPEAPTLRGASGQ